MSPVLFIILLVIAFIVGIPLMLLGVAPAIAGFAGALVAYLVLLAYDRIVGV